ncbi:hypothetical protein MBLNU230_g7242t1 [Neophaeotheca triangularis]
MIPIGPLGVVALIFGGCCSNVFALEAIIKSEPGSGLLIAFFQFVFTGGIALCTQLNVPFLETGSIIRKPTVPLARWVAIAAMFFAINMLNNWAFAFKVSVPIHIILRSFGSVTTMLAGVIRGKRYSFLQVASVLLLTVGVLVSAWADSESKGKDMSASSESDSTEFMTGLAILLLAQIFSAYMGAYVEDTYAEYGADWTENLFYSHILSLPLFLPLFSQLQTQYSKLAATAPLDLSLWLSKDLFTSVQETPRYTPNGWALHQLQTLPQGLVFLFINAITQLACISGVNLLSAKSSAVTVTIVLNIRKLVSFIFSTWIFGHELSGKMVAGAVLVFGSGALYGWETSWRLPSQRAAKQGDGGKSQGGEGANGRLKKTK